MPPPRKHDAAARLHQARQHHAAGRLAEAVAIYEAVLAREPRHADALHLLGVAHMQVGRTSDALALIERAIAIRPDFHEAHNNRGNLLKVAGRIDEAVLAYRAALAANPRYAAAHHHLGIALFEAGDLDAAVSSYRSALHIVPGFADALSNLGTALRDLGQLDDAVRCYEQALALQPDRAETLGGMGVALHRLDRIPEALACYERALAKNPGNVDWQLSRSMLLLSLGRLAEGWPGFESRLRRKDFEVTTGRAPRWRGESLAGKTLLCLAEQGLGDTLQFIRFASALAATAHRVVVAAPHRLLPLLRTVPNVEIVANSADKSHADYHIALMSLPGAMGTVLDDLPIATRYLSPDPGRVAHWRDRLPPGRLRVGLAWQGNPRPDVDRGRSLPLAALAPLFGIEDVSFVSLQAGAGAEQAADLAGRLTVFDEARDSEGAFIDTAAIIGSLDLVVTTDTAMAHLAGALGARTWTLLQKVPDWRWLRERDDSPWYPTMRLFRQSERGDWSGPVDRLADALTQLNGAADDR